MYGTIFVGLFHSILCLLILYVLFSRLGYNEKYTHTHPSAGWINVAVTLNTASWTIGSYQTVASDR